MSRGTIPVQRCDGTQGHALRGQDDAEAMASLEPCPETTTDWWALYAPNWRELFHDWVYDPRADIAQCPRHAAISARLKREWDAYFADQPSGDVTAPTPEAPPEPPPADPSPAEPRPPLDEPAPGSDL